MDGKTVIASLLFLSLVMGQVQVEAKSCCPTTTARNIYNVCRLGGVARPVCARTSGCQIVSGTTCPTGSILEATGDNVNEYCKLGCAFSVCGAIITLENSGTVPNTGAAEKCNNACSAFCTKSSIAAVESA